MEDVAQIISLPRPFEIWTSNGCGRLNFWVRSSWFCKIVYFLKANKIHKGITVTNFNHSCHIHILSHPWVGGSKISLSGSGLKEPERCGSVKRCEWPTSLMYFKCQIAFFHVLRYVILSEVWPSYNLASYLTKPNEMQFSTMSFSASILRFCQASAGAM